VYGAQILLEQDQRQRLEVLARESGRSISQLVREAMTEYLDMADRQESLRRSLRALEELDALRQATQGEVGIIQTSLLDDIRDGRAKESGP
jgi:hypothetical protein